MYFKQMAPNCYSKPAFAAMHGPHSVFDIGKCTFIHCGAGGVSLVDQLKTEKNDIRLSYQ